MTRFQKSFGETYGWRLLFDVCRVERLPGGALEADGFFLLARVLEAAEGFFLLATESFLLLARVLGAAEAFVRWILAEGGGLQSSRKASTTRAPSVSFFACSSKKTCAAARDPRS